MAKYQNVVTQSTKQIDADTYATKMTCDADAGVTIETWDDAECKGEAEVSHNIPWDECRKAGDVYIKITGATALKAAAIAVVAFAGSQF